MLDEIFGSRTPADWETVFESESIWWKPTHSIEEAAHDDQPAAAGLGRDGCWRRKDAHRGVSDRFQRRSTRCDPPLIPKSGQYTEEVLLELGYNWDGIVERREVGALPRVDSSGSACPERACGGNHHGEWSDAADGKTKTRSKRCSKSTEA